MAEGRRKGQANPKVGSNALRVQDDKPVVNSRRYEDLITIPKLKNSVSDRNHNLAGSGLLEGEVTGQALTKNVKEHPDSTYLNPRF